MQFSLPVDSVSQRFFTKTLNQQQKFFRGSKGQKREELQGGFFEARPLSPRNKRNARAL